MKTYLAGALFLIADMFTAPPTAEALTFSSGQLDNGIKFISVEGEFQYAESLAGFTNLVKRTDPTFVTFSSPGGNPIKAIELGRLIRILNLATYQPRNVDCASACALAFLGGTIRIADPGAIGVHKSSFSGSTDMNVDSAVSQVQHLTAETITYMVNMGVDPALLELSLKYEKDDIRYLSKSEMIAYRVTTPLPENNQNLAVQDVAPPAPPSQPQTAISASRALPGNAIASPDARFEVPLAKSGKVRHPEGSEYLRAGAEQAAAKLAKVRNGDPVTILNVTDRWYYVRVDGQTGYLHHNWVKVDQFINTPFGNRYIQIASFDNFAEAQGYIAKSQLRLKAYYAANNWFAVALTGTYPAKVAAQTLKQMKADGSIPEDAFMTVGNTYVSKACCE